MSGQYGQSLKDLLERMHISDSEKLVAEGETLVIDTKAERILLSRKDGVLSIRSLPSPGSGSIAGKGHNT
ncbi:MAG: hypothetical protein C4K47_05165 [Candidatus Thorarchaeota archaeon]|nr:MAG: hypothetical protein C4K47_05165 [Candidatus Thorarchaeota archaeon]